MVTYHLFFKPLASVDKRDHEIDALLLFIPERPIKFTDASLEAELEVLIDTVPFVRRPNNRATGF